MRRLRLYNFPPPPKKKNKQQQTNKQTNFGSRTAYACILSTELSAYYI